MSFSGQLERAEVHVLVELEAHLQQEAALDDAGRDLRGADGAEEDGVVATDLGQRLVGQDRAVAQVAGAAEVELGGVELDTGGPDDLQGLGHHLGADPVSSDDCDLVHVRCLLASGLGVWAGPLGTRGRSLNDKAAHRSGRLEAHTGLGVRYWMMITGARTIAGKCRRASLEGGNWDPPGPAARSRPERACADGPEPSIALPDG